MYEVIEITGADNTQHIHSLLLDWQLEIKLTFSAWKISEIMQAYVLTINNQYVNCHLYFGTQN